MLDHNVALLLCAHRKPVPAQLLLRKALSGLIKQLPPHSERSAYVRRCKENMLLCGLIDEHQSYGLLVTAKELPGSNSYKLNYRKAQACLNHYHELLANPPRLLPY